MESFLTGAHIRQNKHLVDFEQPIVPCKADTHTYSTSVFKSLLLSPLCRSEWKNIKGKIFPCRGRASISARREKQGKAVDKTSGSRGSLTPTWSPFFLHSLESRITVQFYWPLRLVQQVKKMCETLLPARETMFKPSSNHQDHDHTDLKAWCEDTEKPHRPPQLWGRGALLLLACPGWETQTRPVYSVGTFRE